ncbi:MAG: glycosyltransferase, partial [Promethearchaeota archaeon]
YYLPFQAPGFNAGIFKLILFYFKFLFFGIVKAINIIRNEKIDFIHVHTPPPSGIIAFIIYKLFKIPYFYTMHGLEVPVKFILNLNFRFSAKHAKKTFIVNRHVIKYIKQRYNLPNLVWIPNGIKVPTIYPTKNNQNKSMLIRKSNLDNFLEKDDFIISYIGYMIFQHKVRGMIDFLNGFDKFLKKLPSSKEKSKVKLIYIGDGEYSYLLEDEIKKLKLEDQVFILGERLDVENILALSELLALTSYIEGFPMVILEAMAAKVPCLASNVGEISHIIGKTGYIVQPGDVESIGKELENYYILTESKREQMREQAYNRVKELFDIKVIVRKLKEYYSLII